MSYGNDELLNYLRRITKIEGFQILDQVRGYNNCGNRYYSR